uniref:Receptor ligand binding region domain-containing protein n=1 Tax=Varanus komodoensis TaxID=61221 RepID=A0A8D2LNN4_VARKO
LSETPLLTSFLLWTSLLGPSDSYQHALALAFAVNETNQSPNLLPNVTLGFHIYDSYYDAKMTYHNTLELLGHSRKFVPNYIICLCLCTLPYFLLSFLTYLYILFQLTFGSFSPEKRDVAQAPSFYNMVPNEAHQFIGIIWLLQHFRWTWVGIFAVDDTGGDHFLQILEPLLSSNKICSAFTKRIPKQGLLLLINDLAVMALNIYPYIIDEKAKTCLIYGESMALLWLSTFVALADPGHMENGTFEKVWITTTQIDFSVTGFQCAKHLHLLVEYMLNGEPVWCSG